MVDFLLVVEAFLDEEGIFHRRDATGQLLFELPFGRTSYECVVHQVSQTLNLAAFWNGNIDLFQVDVAREVLVRLNNAGSYDGQTFMNLHKGWVCHMVSVESSWPSSTYSGQGQSWRICSTRSTSNFWQWSTCSTEKCQQTPPSNATRPGIGAESPNSLLR